MSKRSRMTWFLAGISVSQVGDIAQTFALGVYVYEVTGSALALANTIAVRVLTSLAIAPIAGSLADRFEPARVMAILSLASALVCFTLPFASTILEIYIAVMGLTILSKLFSPSFRMFLLSVVDSAGLIQADALRTAISRGIAISAPVLAGWLFQTRGARVIFVVNGLTFLFSAMCISIANRGASTQLSSGAKAAVRHPFAQLLREPAIARLLLLEGIVSIAIGFSNVAIIPLVFNELKFSAATYGVLSSIVTTGEVCSLLILARTGKSTLLVQFLALASLGFVLTGLSRDFTVLAASRFILGAAVNAVPLLIINRIQIAAQQGLKGKSLGLVSMAENASYFLGLEVAGASLGSIGPRIVFFVGSLLTIGAFVGVLLTEGAKIRIERRG
ncbi:MAG: MFS transporter [Thermoleophilia bacterium]